MKKIAYILLLLALTACGTDKTEQLKGLWVLDSKEKLRYSGFGDSWGGGIIAAEVYEEEGILFFDKSYMNEKNDGLTLNLSDGRITMNTFFGEIELHVSDDGDTLAFADSIYRKTSKQELEVAIEHEAALKKQQKIEYQEKKKQEQIKREALQHKQRLEREVLQQKQKLEREKNHQLCSDLKKKYKEVFSALSKKLNYNAYKYNDPERNVVKTKYRAERKALQGTFKKEKAKINNCW